MTDPCKQEAVITKLLAGADDRNSRLLRIEERQIGVVQDLAHMKARTTSIIDGQNTIEKKIIAMTGDITHIRSRIDNGLSETVAKLHDSAIRQEPLILHHSKWINRLEAACVAALYGIALLGCAVIIWAFTRGFKGVIG